MLGYKRYNTVIMDGSSKFVNQEIVGMIDMITRKRIGKSKCRPLGKDYPTMMVVKRFTSATKYWETRRAIEKNYPGVCTFDAVL